MPENKTNDSVKKLLEDMFPSGSFPGVSSPFSGLFDRAADRVVACKACQQKNRVRAGKEGARCGKCGLPL